MVYKSNQERTADFFKNFDRYSTLKNLVTNENPTIFDIGANIGQTSLEMLDHFPNATIHCFEPIAEFFKELTDNTKDKNCILNNFALTDKTGLIKFYYHKLSPSLSGIYQINTDSKDSVALNNPKLAGINKDYFLKNINDTVKVESNTLNNYVENKKISKIDILKMDVQGGEALVLEGGKSILSNVDVILTEVNFYDLYTKSHSFSDIEKYLLPEGFKLYDISHISKNPMNGRTDWIDAVYAKL